MKDYTITAEMLKGILSHAYNCGYHCAIRSNYDAETSLGLTDEEVQKTIFESVEKHDKDVKDFSRKLNEYSLWV